MGCEHLSDRELLEAFENCTLAKEKFHHADHVRVAWIYLGRFGADAEQRFLSGIQRLAAQFGVPEKFHYTITVAWMRLVAARCRSHSDFTQGSYFQWITNHSELLDQSLLTRYYSPNLLKTAAAKYGWLKPNLQDLPEAGSAP